MTQVGEEAILAKNLLFSIEKMGGFAWWLEFIPRNRKAKGSNRRSN